MLSMTHRLAAAAIVVLLILAWLGKSGVMAVSVAGMGLTYWWTATAPLKRQMIFAFGAAIAFSLIAETIHTIYHIVRPETGGPGDSGGFWMSALLVGAINAIAFTTVLGLLELLKKREP